MRTMDTKKQEFELNVVRLFREAGGLNAGAELLLGADPPDVVAISSGSKIGIEVRRIFMDETRNGSLGRERLRTFQDVIKHAALLHSKISNKFLHISVTFCPDANIPKSKKESIASLMVAQVSKLNLDVGQRFNLRSEDLWGSTWPEAVLRITGGCLQGEGPPFWGLSSWSFLYETNDEVIQNALNSKENAIGKWRTEFNGTWVLLVIDGSVSASFVRPHGKINANVYQSSFDRAFVMEFNGTTFKELRLSRHEETV